jgi:Zn ribbon nucleic-acid-binding protein
MGPIIFFKCRACDSELSIPPSQAERVVCPHCHTELPLFINDSITDRATVTACVSCGHDALYVQKDFNRQVGLVIVGIGIATSIYFFARSQPIFAMIALGLTAVVDFLAYSLVPDVTVCYSCHAVYRGFSRNPEHEPFDLKKLEKYGGRAPRGSPQGGVKVGDKGSYPDADRDESSNGLGV